MELHKLLRGILITYQWFKWRQQNARAKYTQKTQRKTTAFVAKQGCTAIDSTEGLGVWIKQVYTLKVTHWRWVFQS